MMALDLNQNMKVFIEIPALNGIEAGTLEY